MSMHVFGLTIGMLTDAAQAAARVTDRPVLLIDDVAHVVVLIDRHGRLVVRPETRSAPSGDVGREIPKRSLHCRQL